MVFCRSKVSVVRSVAVSLIVPDFLSQRFCERLVNNLENYLRETVRNVAMRTKSEESRLQKQWFLKAVWKQKVSHFLNRILR